MAEFKWANRAEEETVLSTELNSLTDGSNKITTSAITNPNNYMYADFELSLATQGAARDTGAYVSLYILPNLDGTNYAYGGDALDPSSNHFRGSFKFDAAINARVDIIEGVLLPVDSFHVLVENVTGENLASSGNTLTMRRYNTQSS